MVDIFEERARIARELHDGIAQELAAIGYAIDSEIGRSDLSEGSRRNLRALRERITQVNSRVRQEIFLLRSNRAPSPQEALQEGLSSLGLNCAIEGALPDSEMGLELFKVIQEIARNARTHGAATSLELNITPSRISIKNDGKATPSVNSPSFGLQGITERLHGINWELADNSDFGLITLINEA